MAAKKTINFYQNQKENEMWMCCALAVANWTGFTCMALNILYYIVLARESGRIWWWVWNVNHFLLGNVWSTDVVLSKCSKNYTFS